VSRTETMPQVIREYVRWVHEAWARTLIREALAAAALPAVARAFVGLDPTSEAFSDLYAEQPLTDGGRARQARARFLAR
jgi:hypothetical protein